MVRGVETELEGSRIHALLSWVEYAATGIELLAVVIIVVTTVVATSSYLVAIGARIVMAPARAGAVSQTGEDPTIVVLEMGIRRRPVGPELCGRPHGNRERNQRGDERFPADHGLYHNADAFTS